MLFPLVSFKMKYMISARNFVIDVKIIEKEDVSWAGEEAVKLAEIYNLKILIPKTHVLTSYAHKEFILFNRLDKKIKHLLGTINHRHHDSLEQATHHIINIIRKSPIPPSLSEQLFNFYEKNGKEKITISCIKQSLGIKRIYKEISGESAFIEKVREIWASLYTPALIHYALENKIDLTTIFMPLLIQEHVHSPLKGTLFTLNHVSNNKGQYILKIEEERKEYKEFTEFFINKTTHKIEERVSRRIKSSEAYLKKKKTYLSFFKNDKSHVTDDLIADIIKIEKRVVKNFYFPQEIEWVYVNGHIAVRDIRPIPLITIKSKLPYVAELLSEEFSEVKPLTKGLPTHAGIKIGPVKIINEKNNNEKMKNHEIIIVKKINETYIHSFKKAGALLFEEELYLPPHIHWIKNLGIPVIVGTRNVSEMVKDGDVVTVNGKTGKIYKGGVFIN